MADLKVINLGNVVNDGTGDDLREAFEKVKFNFSELDARTPEATTVANLGTGEGIFSNQQDAELRFKSLVGGTNATLTSDANSITINVDAGVTQFTVAGDSGSFIATENTIITIAGGRLVTTERSGDSIVINTSALENLADDPAPQLSANLNAAGHDIGNINTLTAAVTNSNLNGNVVGLVHNIDIRDLNYYREPNNSWDFGTLLPQPVNNLWDFLFATITVDFGTINNPSQAGLDAGTLVSPSF